MNQNNQNNIDVNKLNDFLDTANQTLSCDSNCQEKKKISELKKKIFRIKNKFINRS